MTYNKTALRIKRGVSMTKTISTFIIIIACMTLLVGCNTMQGLGKDIKKAGKAIEEAAE
jgi:predicted small secreted protein